MVQYSISSNKFLNDTAKKYFNIFCSPIFFFALYSDPFCEILHTFQNLTASSSPTQEDVQWQYKKKEFLIW